MKGEEGRGKSLVGCRSSLLIVACCYSLALLAARSLVVVARSLLVVARRWSLSEGPNERASERMSDLASERMSDGARQPQQMWRQNRSVAHHFNRWSAIHSQILGGERDRAIYNFGESITLWANPMPTLQIARSHELPIFSDYIEFHRLK